MRARTFGALAHGRIGLRSREAGTISSSGGDPATGAALDPAAGGGNACVEIDPAQAPGTVVLSKTVRPGRAVTLIGAVKVRAGLAIEGTEPTGSQIAARLWDVAPDGSSQLLVANDVPYARKSNDEFTVELTDLRARLPVRRLPR